MSDLKIKYIDIKNLKFNKKNPRKNDQAIDMLVKSIKEFGFVNPVLIDKDNQIIAGHTRVKAASKLEMQLVPTITLDQLTPEQAKAYMIADNKLNEIADWDDLLLKELLHELPPTMDVEALGFTLDEIEKMIEGFEPEIKEKNTEPKPNDLSIVVLCENEDQQQALFIELRERGFVVK